MLQAPATFGEEVDRAVALAPFGLGPGDADPKLPPQIVSTGVPQLLVPVGDAGVLDRVAPAETALRDLLSGTGCITAYLVSSDADRAVAQARSFFLDPTGVSEDPATGSAAGPLMAYLNARTGVQRLAIEQGVAMGRPSRLLCESAPSGIRVAGDVVVVFDGTLTL
jgi:trans-2,3-dihydro-3-hydroxyanthranilate isomerase